MNFQDILQVLAGLGIFLYGINLMSASLKKIAGSKLKIILEKATNTPIKGVLIGFLITAIIQSSSGTTAIVVGLITAGLLTLPQAIHIIIGANIGTTTTGLLIGIKIGEYAPLFIFLGAILIFFCHRKRWKNIGSAILGFGFLFFGLTTMSAPLTILAKQEFFINMIRVLSSNRILSFLTGGFLTAIIQSSSASIGIIQELYATGDIGLQLAIPVILGANVGTTITGILSSFGGNRASKRAALFHTLFNLIGSVLFLLILDPVVAFTSFLEKNLFFLSPHSSATLGVFNFLFNIVMCVLLVGFVPYFVKLIIKIIPYSKKEEIFNPGAKLKDSLIDASPVLAIESARFLLCDMMDITTEMFNAMREFVSENNPKHAQVITESEAKLDVYEAQLHDYLTKLVSSSLNIHTAHVHSICLDTIRDLERIGDHCTNIKEFMQERYTSNIAFHPSSHAHIQKMIIQLDNMMQAMKKAFQSVSQKDAQQILDLEPGIDEMEKAARKEELALLAEGKITTTDVHFVDILANLERIGDHCTNVAENILVDSLHAHIIKEND